MDRIENKLLSAENVIYSKEKKMNLIRKKRISENLFKLNIKFEK